jgi:hypothetical protein
MFSSTVDPDRLFTAEVAMSKIHGLLTVCLATVLLGGSATATIWDVPGDANTIQGGIDLAASGDTVMVAAGTYNEPQKAITGTFAVFDSAMIVLSPGVRLISASGAASTTIDAADSGRVLFCAEGTAGTLIKGFTITGGNIDREATVEPGHGGGLCAIACTIKVENCVFVDNEAFSHGGAKIDSKSGLIVGCRFENNYVTSSSAGLGIEEYNGSVVRVTVDDCDFIDNVVDASTGGGGGGACVYPGGVGSLATITNSTFSGNRAPYAGVGHWSGPTTVTDCVFESNEATGHATFLRAGALWLGSTIGTNTFTDCTFSANIGSGFGGALYIQRGTYEFDGCAFVDNESPSGGAVWIGVSGTAAARFDVCMFDGNDATTGDGGAIGTSSAAGATLRLHRCLLVDNAASDDGGALMCAGDADVAMDSCTVVGNDADGSGGGIFADNMSVSAQPYVTKSIIAANIGGGAVMCEGDSSLPYLGCCDVWGNTGGNYGGCIDVSGINNNISSNPQFCGGGYTPYNVQSGSPCYNLANCGTIGIGAPCIEDPTPKTGPAGAATAVADFLINMPNPFNPITTIAFRLVTAGEADLSIFSLDGRRVKVLTQGTRIAGQHEVTWNGRNDHDEEVSSGTYYARLETASGVMTRTLTLLK